MAKKDLFGDEIQEQPNDFASMLNQSMGLVGKQLKVGDKITGEILTIGKDECFVSTGTAVDGLLPTQELLDNKGEQKYKVGDIIDTVVIKFVQGTPRLRKSDAKSGLTDLENLEDAFDMEIPVEGKVIEVVKGGFRVKISGKVAFCPISQIDLRANEDLNSYVGLKSDFIITQYEDRNIVVSRRKLLEQQRVEREGDFINHHKPGELIEGIVKRLESFGAFVELPLGVEGLVHISEISWNRLKHPSEALEVGTKIRAKILKIDDSNGRVKISLSIKQGGGETDPRQNETQDENEKISKGTDSTHHFGTLAQALKSVQIKK